MTQRGQKFREDLDRLLRLGGPIKRTQLLATFMGIYSRGYNAGLVARTRRAVA